MLKEAAILVTARLPVTNKTMFGLYLPDCRVFELIYNNMPVKLTTGNKVSVSICILYIYAD